MKALRHISFVLSLALMLSSCAELVLRVDEIPANTPAGSDIFVSGNFNFWDTADERYRLKLGADSAWYVTLPQSSGDLEFYFTRGDLTSLEADGCGNRLPRRTFRMGVSDTLTCTIDAWLDREPLKCELITIVIDSLPENTPEGERIVLAGDFNNWNATDTTYTVKKDASTGKYFVQVPRPLDRIEYSYIITRGNLKAAEADAFGRIQKPRKLSFGKEDTLCISVENWEDMVEGSSGFVTLILDKVPANTPSFEALYVAADLNDWYPRDEEYKMTRLSDGRYSLKLRKQGAGMHFKFTRGDWPSVEGDVHGLEIGNRYLSFDAKDTIHLEVQSWKDLFGKRSSTIRLSVEVPPGTPEDAEIFVAGDFNGWAGNAPGYKMKRENSVKYTLELPHRFGGSGFKLTRGSWDNQEVHLNGKVIANRRLEDNGTGVLNVKVEAWFDLLWKKAPPVVFVIEDLPKNSPEAPQLFMACDMFDWKLSLELLRFKKNSEGKWQLELKPKPGVFKLQYKINRGNWDTVESKRWGGETENRYYTFGVGDTVRINIAGWADL